MGTRYSPHEGIKVLQRSQSDSDADELLEEASTPLELALDEDHARDPISEVLRKRCQSTAREVKGLDVR
jgi:hypothetical protein